MADEDPLAATIDARVLETARTMEHLPGATVVPDDLDAWAEETVARALGSLSEASGLAIRGTIGEGGMGVVRAGTQLSLGREVAIKTLKDDARSERATLKLLREAWVTGALEHPNVVPVYDLSLDASGGPRIVLKRIAGEPWADLMHARATLRDRFGAHDALEWNLRILMQVCNAVRFAHSRGILHRDLKPENVMIGEFGEVYVLDWGLAVAMRDDGSGRLPLAKDAVEMAGTPAYMAPEMLGGDPPRIDERTDVYLLGALLYEIVAGRPPHAPEGGAPMMQILASIVRSEPELPETIEVELARIVRRAMHRDPTQRFESAEQLRLALGRFLEQRGSLALAADAQRRLRDLEDERSEPIGDADEARLRLYHLFGECRFGFLEALRIWHENEVARTGLRRALTLMIELELEQGDPKAASVLLAELTSPPQELVVRVNDARRAKEREEAKRAALVRQFDPSIGRRTRVVVSTILGVIWTVLPWIGFALEQHDPTIDQRAPLLSSCAMLVLASVIGYWAREALSRTALNRSLVRVVAAVLIGQVALYAVTWKLAITYEQTRPLVLLLYAVCASLTASALERRFWPAALAMCAAFVLAAVWPTYAWPFESFANLVLTVNVLVIWGRVDDEERASIAVRR
ncbi:serine/threonine-protein kinase [Sandaracinus amylolyticus]|uniref:serine/threonine-protein kinase n=1 Tax=Sandaracinus amylolyticus TaxID=927083 RepID=UPI001F38C25C|nr:serine/threonine-protein kinase [Sandaracinus amylolyticus]UJR83877.1 Hypothetical protein I5071_59480 [Sandaracinus amylolyticus]